MTVADQAAAAARGDLAVRRSAASSGGSFEPLAAGAAQLRQRRRRDRADLLRADRLRKRDRRRSARSAIPTRTIPRALIGGTAFVGAALSRSPAPAIQLLLPADVVAASPAPSPMRLAVHWGHGAATFAALIDRRQPRSAASTA